MTNRALVAVVATTVALVAGGGMVAASIAVSGADTSSTPDGGAADTTAVVRETVAPGALAISSRDIPAEAAATTAATATTVAVESMVAGAASAAIVAPAAPPTTPAAPPTTPAAPPGRFQISTTSLDLGASETIAAFHIVNIGGRPADWRIEGDTAPFVVAGGLGTLAPGQAAQIAVVLDRTNLTEGDYATTLVLSGATPTPIAVVARVERPPVVALRGEPDPVAQEVCEPREVSVSVEAADESGIATVVAQLDGPTGSGAVELVEAGLWSFTMMPPPVVGDWAVDIVATDGRGNRATLATSFVVTPCTGDGTASLRV